MYVKPMTTNEGTMATDEGTDHTRTLMIIRTCIQRSFSPDFLSLFHFILIKGFGNFLLIETDTTL